MALIAYSRQIDLKEYTVAAYKESIEWLRDYITAIKQGKLHPFTKLERKAREATRNEPWGPTGTILNELAEASFDGADCEVIFAVIQLRLGYPPAKWRNVYKALTLLEFLLKRGSERCVGIAREELLPRLEDLEGFQFVSPEGRDQGVNVRHRAQAIRALLRDERRLGEERAAFRAKRRAYTGFSRDQMAGPNGVPSSSLSAASPATPALRRSRSETGESGSHQQASSSPEEATPQSRPPRPITRGAGEMKGVTMEENKAQLAALRRLLEAPGNRACADCQGGGAAGRASWASINTGVFICMRCAGIHRGLGVHISKVRSVTLDTWLPSQVAFMAATGNAAANAHYEAQLDPAQKPSYYSPDLDAFIRRKYAGEWAEGEWPPAHALAGALTPERTTQDQQQPASAVSTSAPGSRAASGGLWTARQQETPQVSGDGGHSGGFEENAFAPPDQAQQRPPSVPDLWDFCESDEDAGAVAAAAQQQHVPAAAQQAVPAGGMPRQQFSAGAVLAPPHATQPIGTAAGAAQGPAAAALQEQQPQQAEPDVAASGLGGFEELMAASAQPNLMDANNPFGSSAFATSAGHVTASSSSSSFELLSLEQPSQAPNASGTPAVPKQLHGDFAAAASLEPAHTAAAKSGAAPAPPLPAAAAAAHQLSFGDNPAPAWGVPSAPAPQPGSFSMTDNSKHAALHPPMRPMQSATTQEHASASSGASVPNQATPSWAQERPAGPGLFWATHGSGLTSTTSEPGPGFAPKQAGVQRSRTASADPGSFVLKDLLSHAVENLRLKNSAGSTLSGGARAPPPSLMEQKVASSRPRIASAGM